MIYIITNYGTQFESQYTVEQFISAVSDYFYPLDIDLEQVVIKASRSEKVKELERAVAIVQELVPSDNFLGVIVPNNTRRAKACLTQ